MDAVRTSYRLDAHKKTGWPLTRWLSKIRPDPLRRLSLKSTDVNPKLNRHVTSRPGIGATGTGRFGHPPLCRWRPAPERPKPGRLQSGARRVKNAATTSRQARPSNSQYECECDQGLLVVAVGVGHPVGVLGNGFCRCFVAGSAWPRPQYLQFSLPAAPRVEGFPVPTLDAYLGCNLAGSSWVS